MAGWLLAGSWAPGAIEETLPAGRSNRGQRVPGEPTPGLVLPDGGKDTTRAANRATPRQETPCGRNQPATHATSGAAEASSGTFKRLLSERARGA